MITTRNWSIGEFVDAYKFQPVKRIPYANVVPQDIIDYENGLPLIIEGWHNHPLWCQNFNIDFYKDSSPDPHNLSVRNICDSKDNSISIDQFLYRCRTDSVYTRIGETSRLYAKDAPCPKNWKDWLQNSGVIPSSLIPDSRNNVSLNLPKDQPVETLMCYLGIGDTVTAFHKDLCASAGHNLMCYTERGGSSFWFMTDGSIAPDVSAYFRQNFATELDCENFAPTPQQLMNATFPIFVAEQKLGDLVLVPPRSAHQVVNSGGLTVKTSWSRMTLRSLEISLYHELPLYRRICRPETYRTKMTLYYTLCTYLQSSTFLPHDDTQTSKIDPSLLSAPAIQDIKDMQKAIELFDFLLQTEFLPTKYQVPSLVSEGEATSLAFPPSHPPIYLTCDLCAADIFNGFFECSECHHPRDPDECITICPGCYIEGRNCRCRKSRPKRIQPFNNLLALRGQALTLLMSHRSSLPLDSLPSPPSFNFQLLVNDELNAIFLAAVLLSKNLGTHEYMKCQSFRAKRDKTHDTSSQWILRCQKGCHGSICFHHLLSVRGIHSVDAIIVYQRDADHMQFHNLHKEINSNRVYKEKLDDIVKVQREGSPWPNWGRGPTFAGLYLSYLAQASKISQFDLSKPITEGFYDHFLLDIQASPQLGRPASPSAHVGVPSPTPTPTLSKKRKRLKQASSPRKQQFVSSASTSDPASAQLPSAGQLLHSQPPPTPTLYSILSGSSMASSSNIEKQPPVPHPLLTLSSDSAGSQPLVTSTAPLPLTPPTTANLVSFGAPDFGTPSLPTVNSLDPTHEHESDPTPLPQFLPTNMDNHPGPSVQTELRLSRQSDAYQRDIASIAQLFFSDKGRGPPS